MKKLFEIGFALCSLTACSEKNAQNPQDLNSELTKIETSWDGIAVKNDFIDEPQKELLASEKITSQIKLNINKRYQEYLESIKNQPILLKVAGNYVGVIKNTPGDVGCNGYKEVRITMDCEDSRPATKYQSGNYRPDWVVDGNITMRFCIVPGFNFHPHDKYDYALLRVSNTFFPDAREVGVFFDNEDTNNANSAAFVISSNPIRVREQDIKNQTSDASSIYRTYIDNNTYLGLHLFQSRPGGMKDFPSFNFSYGVFGSFGDGNTTSKIWIDDEDNKVANDYFVDDTDDSNLYAIPTFIPGIIESVIGFSKVGPFNQLAYRSDHQMYVTKVK